MSTGSSKFVWGLCIFLGVFEFFAAYKFVFHGPEADAIAKVFVLGPSERILYTTYILTLGLQRLTYASGLY